MMKTNNHTNNNDNSDTDELASHQQQHQQQQQRSANKKKVRYHQSDSDGIDQLPHHHVSVSERATPLASSKRATFAIDNGEEPNDTSFNQDVSNHHHDQYNDDTDLASNNTTNTNNNNNNRYSRDDMAGSVISDESGDHSIDSGGEEDYGDGVNSSISGSSGSSQGSKGLKSSIPCNKQLGCTIVHLMTISVLVPITFLVVFTSLSLSKSLAASAFLSEHRAVFTGIRNLGDYNLWERLNSTFLITYDEDDPLYANFSTNTRISRDLFDKQVLSFTEEVMRESDLEDRQLFMRDLDLLMREIGVDREKIDSRTAFPPDYRDRQIDLINQMTRLLLYFAQDTRGALLRHRIVLYVFVRRIQNLFSATFGSAVGVINAGNNTNLYTSNIRALQSSYDSVTADLALTLRAADRGIANEIQEVRDSVTWNRWTATVRLFLRENNRSKFAHITEANLTEWYNAASSEFDSVDRRVLNRITNGELLSAVALEAALMMTFALLASCVALAVVVYYNNKEQKRMERALDATAVLANAVQRFVPKNQLKTMGVRSITQVTPGMTTEVAQTITFSDIRGFTRLSESMTRLELFDWLQNYVARMTKVVSEEKSYIMAFLGDGLGICSPQPTYALNAAVKMHVSVEELNLNLIAKNGTLPIKIGVGVNHGVVVAGVFGDANRLTCTMIAPDVNFASRLEALTKSFGVKILASESTIDHISSEVFSYRKVGKVQVAGSGKSVPVYDVYNNDELSTKIMKDETKQEFEHAVSIFESDPPEAVKIFESLLLRARMKGRSDECCEMYRKRFQNGGSSGASVLSFEKDGELKNSNAMIMENNNNGSFVNESSGCIDSVVLGSNSLNTHNTNSNKPGSPLRFAGGNNNNKQHDDSSLPLAQVKFGSDRLYRYQKQQQEIQQESQGQHTTAPSSMMLPKESLLSSSSQAQTNKKNNNALTTSGAPTVTSRRRRPPASSIQISDDDDGKDHHSVSSEMARTAENIPSNLSVKNVHE